MFFIADKMTCLRIRRLDTRSPLLVWPAFECRKRSRTDCRELSVMHHRVMAPYSEHDRAILESLEEDD